MKYRKLTGGGIYPIMARKQKAKKKRKEEIPFSKVRKPIPRPGSTMKSKRDYTRKKKHKKDWLDNV